MNEEEEKQKQRKLERSATLRKGEKRQEKGKESHGARTLVAQRLERDC